MRKNMHLKMECVLTPASQWLVDANSTTLFQGYVTFFVMLLQINELILNI